MQLFSPPLRFLYSVFDQLPGLLFFFFFMKKINLQLQLIPSLFLILGFLTLCSLALLVLMK